MPDKNDRFKVLHSENLTEFSILALSLEERFGEVSKSLPWVEPSINMIHLEAVRSYVFRSPLASLSSSVLLLEHTLRMAIWDSEGSGKLRRRPSSSLFDETLGTLLTKEKYLEKVMELLPEERDRHWWMDVKNAVRNKVTHFDLPAVFRIAKALKLKDDYAYSGFDSGNSWDPGDPISWGMFWHRFGDKLAADFLNATTEQIRKLIQKTRWSSDQSWWASQQSQYELFFKQKWDISSLRDSLANV